MVKNLGAQDRKLCGSTARGGVPKGTGGMEPRPSATWRDHLLSA